MHSSISRSVPAAKALAVCAVTASLCAAASCAEANRNTQNLPRSASAALHLTVFVVPVLHPREEMAPKRQESPIVFTLTSPPLNETYEVRAFIPAEKRHGGKPHPAILRTLTIVPQ